MTTAFSIDAAGALPGPDWLVSRRRAAAERFASTELPSADEEVWRYSRIGDLDLDRYPPVGPDAVPAGAPDAASEIVALADGADLVVLAIDGRVTDVRSADGCAATVGLPDDDATTAVGVAQGDATDFFTLLNVAFSEPIEITVPAGTDIARIVVVQQFSSPDHASFPRLVVHAGQASHASVVEVHVSDDGVDHLSVPVTELVVDRDATLHHVVVQLLGDHTWQIGRLASTVAQGATLRSGTAAFGGDYSRLRIDTTLAGRGATGDLYAGYFGSGSQLLDFRTFQDHAAPDTTSNLLFKGALDERGASVYTGLIKIRPDARGSQAFQTNRNLKLSDEAWAESVPNLEIENNEVQCSHASTVGPIDAEQRFYLESRGVPADRAERLIVKGVFDEVFDALPLGSYDAVVRAALDHELERSMS